MGSIPEGIDSNSTNDISGGIDYSVPAGASEVFKKGILFNPLISKYLPQETYRIRSHTHFTGSDAPSLPVNWRLAEATSSLKALEATLVNVLLERKYGLEPQPVTINTDQASLFIISTLLWTIDPGPGGENISANSIRLADPKLAQYFPSCDIYRMNSSLYRNLTTNIYKCADGRYFHIHGSLNPEGTLDNIGMPHDMDATIYEEGKKPFVEAFSKISSEDMQKRTDETKEAGTTCYTTDEFRASEHGRANAHVGLFEIHKKQYSSQSPSWWPDSPDTGPSRPLAGLKVVDLTRIIAGPCITRSLAELGASVMRCTSPHLPDVASLLVDLNWGKWNCSIDLRKPEDQEKLRVLIREADVVVQGYRPGVLGKYGFAQDDIIQLCQSRPRGIIYARENCYGWYGPWSNRSGWQQIADANTGLSHSFGQAMGHDGPVTPIFPHSDYCTGIVGSCAIIIALLQRAEAGGSYCIDLALNYYSTWLINSVGTYPMPIWNGLRAEHGNPVYQYWHNNGITAPEVLKSLRGGPGGKRLFRPEFFEDRAASGALGDKKIRVVRAVADWGATVKLGFSVGTRGNGVDIAVWPQDLSVENVV